MGAARLALVTGTSRGLGAAVAGRLLAEDWHVLGVARGEAPAELARNERYEHAQLDLTRLGRVAKPLEARLEQRLEALGSLERIGLVNNAGVLAPIGPMHLSPADELARAALVNVAAPLWTMGLAVRLAKRTPLRIVNISSGAATSPYPGWSSYCAGKSAVRMAGQVLALERAEMPALDGHDVAVVDYSPGVLATDMQAQIRATPREFFPRRQRFVDYHAQGQLVDPERPALEIAALLRADDLEPFSERRFGDR